VARLESHFHVGEALQDQPFGAHWPPVVEIDLERSPHRDPAGDNQAFACDDLERFVTNSPGEAAEKKTRGEKEQSDGEAEVAAAEQQAELAALDLGPVAKVVPDRTLAVGGLVGFGWRGEMDDELKALVARRLPGLAHDEFLGIVIELAIEEGRGIHRIEELGQLAQLQMDPGGMVRVSHGTRCQHG